METKFLRFDIDNPCKSIPKSYLSFKFPKFSDLSYLTQILDLLRDYNQKGTFFFRPDYTMPSPSLIRSLIRDGHEIGHHVDHTVNIKEMQREKLTLESKCGNTLGITIHGHGLPFLSPSGEGFHNRYFEYCVKLGYKYEGTGHYTGIPKTKFFSKLDGLIIFPRHLTFDKFPKTDFAEKTLLAHPVRLVRDKKLLRSFEEVLKRYNFIPQREILNEVVRTRFCRA
ncbi:MAG: polysaccharide deacetylase family protein [Candidatus Bathyarchaeota archaeon]|jgi:hypothetical protein